MTLCRTTSTSITFIFKRTETCYLKSLHFVVRSSIFVVFSDTDAEETLLETEGLAVELQTCLWSEVSGEVGFLVSCYRGLKTRNVGGSLFYPQESLRRKCVHRVTAA